MGVSSSWQPAAHPPVLTTGDVHVWRIALEIGDALLTRLREFLADDERRRAERFHFEKDRRHFIAGRSALRILLAGYLACRPEDVRFTYSSYGKPQLANQASDLRFNLTHSHGLALLAVTRGRDIGVDVERVRDMERDGERLAERFFSPREAAVLRSLPPEQRREAFFSCWTRKEAYIKANGKGLSLPLDQFDVSLRPGEPAALLATRHDPQEVRRWSMQSLLPAEGYVGALAVEGHSWRLWCGDWIAEAG
ncbi:MAG TPA: 4'-phosphopantetheinyl transferase superfamily protein [Gemmataceae bacterium]|nr:4'-phosphopantetheinyl transferase superfamily protein [Gemmataceae bacterium]